MADVAWYHRSCSTHCCPVDGCKYGYDSCPVKTGRVAPEYPNNNECEMCEFRAEQRVEALEGVLIDEQVLSRWLVDNGYAEPDSGFGHVSGDVLAAALLARFTMVDKGQDER